MNSIKTNLLLFVIVSADALIEPGDDPEVIRAKYFIRDEFLVSKTKNLIN